MRTEVGGLKPENYRVIGQGPKFKGLRVGVDPTGRFATVECLSCGAKSVADDRHRVGYVMHRHNCPVFSTDQAMATLIY